MLKGTGETNLDLDMLWRVLSTIIDERGLGDLVHKYSALSFSDADRLAYILAPLVYPGIW